MPAQLLTVPTRKDARLSKTLLYPLRFEPIYQYRLWGGRQLGSLLSGATAGGSGWRSLDPQ